MTAKQVIMERDGQQTDVNNNASVQVMEALGWKVIGDAPVRDQEAGLKALRANLDGTRTWYPQDADEAALQALIDERDAGKGGSQPQRDAETGAPKPPTYDGMSHAAMKELLDAKKIPYPKTASKKDLVEILTEASKAQ